MYYVSITFLAAKISNEIFRQNKLNTITIDNATSVYFEYFKLVHIVYRKSSKARTKQFHSDSICATVFLKRFH